MEIRELLEAAVRVAASDLHLSTGRPPIVRVHGDVQPLEGFAERLLAADEVTAFAAALLDPRQRAEQAQRAEYDFSVSVAGLGRFRGNVYRQQRGPGIALRLIPTHIRTLEELGAPPTLADFVRRHHGLVLVTGPTGSGKSTTAAAMIDLVNRTRAAHIVTIEDPVEYVHESQMCLVTQREVGADTGSFPAALRAALRDVTWGFGASAREDVDGGVPATPMDVPRTLAALAIYVALFAAMVAVTVALLPLVPEITGGGGG